MPVRNEGAYIDASLGAVLAQDYPLETMRVVVVDGLSDDDTQERVQRLAASSPCPVELVPNPGRIVPTGLNLVLQRFLASDAEILVRVDGHCEIAADYVRRCVEHLARASIAGVGGPITTLGETPGARVIAAAMASPFGVGGSAFRVGRAHPTLVDTIAFPAYSRRALELAGPFDEELMRNQDDEYNYRLRKLGENLLLAPDVRSLYYSRARLPKLAKQFFQYGYYKVRVLQKHPRQMRLRQFAPPSFVAALLGALALTLAGASLHRGLLPLGILLLALVALPYLAANLWATLRTMGAVEGHRLLALTRLPVAFAAMHLGYGSGFLAGIVGFAGRWGDGASRPREGSGK